MMLLSRCGGHRLALLLLVCLVWGIAPQSEAGDFELKPNIAVSEEYTDNVFDTPRKRSDYITRAMPGLTLLYKAPLWDWDLAYNFDYRYYARQSRTDDTTHNLKAKGVVKLIDEVLFLELSDVYKRVSLDYTRDTTNENLSTNQSDQNVGIVSPYFVLRPTAALTLRTGYRYTNTWYRDPSATDKRDQVVFLDSSYEISPKLFATAGYSFTREDSSRYGFYRHQLYVGPRYEYAEKSFLFAHAGPTVTEYDDQAETVNPTWNAGVTHVFDTVTVNLSTGVKYTDDPLGNAIEERSYSASLQKTLSRGAVTVSSTYTEFVDTKIDTMTKKRFSAGVMGNYELLQDLRGTLGFNYEHYNYLLDNGHTNKYSVNSSLNYYLGRGLSSSVSHSFIDYASPTIVADNKRINRFIIELRKSF
jgi:hypothetical protein